MNERIRFQLMWLALLPFAYGFGYWTGSWKASRRPQIIVAKDSSDVSPLLAGESVQSFYDPYFTPRNAIPTKVR